VEKRERREEKNNRKEIKKNVVRDKEMGLDFALPGLCLRGGRHRTGFHFCQA
jgi:hypothetical protein